MCRVTYLPGGHSETLGILGEASRDREVGHSGRKGRTKRGGLKCRLGDGLLCGGGTGERGQDEGRFKASSVGRHGALSRFCSHVFHLPRKDRAGVNVMGKVFGTEGR